MPIPTRGERTPWRTPHVTAPTLFAEANGIRYAYRRFGEETGVPLLFMQHFRAGLDLGIPPSLTDSDETDQ